VQTFLKIFFRLTKKAAHNKGIGKKWADGGVSAAPTI